MRCSRETFRHSANPSGCHQDSATRRRAVSLAKEERMRVSGLAYICSMLSLALPAGSADWSACSSALGDLQMEVSNLDPRARGLHARF